MTEWIKIYNKNISLYMRIINSYIFSLESSRYLSVGESLEKLNFKLPSGLKKKEYLQQGLFPVIDQGKISKGGFTNNNNLVSDQQLPMIICGDHTRRIKYVDKPFAIGADGVKLLKPKSYFIEKYYYYILKGLDIGNRGYGRHFKIINSKKISIPFFEDKTKSIEFQNAVVAFMEDFRNNNLKNKMYFCLDIENKIKNIKCESLKINNYLGLNINQKNILQKLRQAFLQDAISGKLTTDWRKKNPNVEPASELLKKIKAEKEKLFAEKKIKREKSLPEITEKEVPFIMPKNWGFCWLQECFVTLSTKEKQLKTKDYLPSGTFPIVDQGKNIICGYTEKENKVFMLNKPIIIFGDHTKVLKYIDFDFAIGADGTKPLVSVSDFVNEKYFFYTLRAIISHLGTKNYGRHFGLLKSSPIPLPPLLEQKAIVEKVESLMQKLDKLETEISQNQKTADRLMQAVLKEAFEQ